MSNCWQVAAGSVGRDYTKAFLEYGIAFVGGDTYGNTMARVEAGDTMILKRGRSEIVAVGRVVSRAGVHYGDARGDDTKFWLRDFDGWDLYAWCYVDWQQPADGSCRATGLTRTTMQQVWQQSLLEIAEQALDDWPRREECAPGPQPTCPVADDQIVDFLIKQGLRIQDAEDLSAALIRIRRLTHYYYNEVEWEHIREHETRTFLVLPLLLALGWSEQQLKIEHPAPQGGGRIDVCAFRRPFRGTDDDQCVLLIETKGFMQGLDYAHEQARTYAQGFPHCKVLFVTNGYCYKAYERQSDTFPNAPTAYLNLRDPRDAYPLDPSKGGCCEVLRLLLPTSHGWPVNPGL